MNGTYLVYPNPGGSGASGIGAAKSAPIGNAASSVSPVFTTAFGSTNYAVLVTVSNVVDSSPIFLQAIVTAKSSSGFTATFNAPTDSANYVLEYIIAGYV